MPVIETNSLTKIYGHQRVLDDVSFQILPGRLVGFLGPNGAGKTTTLRILLGLVRASSGEALIFGKPCHSAGRTIRTEIGYLPGDVHFYSSMTAMGMLAFLSAARKRDCRAEIERLGDALELNLNQKVRTFSTGMKQKLGLIQALMHRPKLLVLDEPTSALDPLVRKTVFAELRQTVLDGRTVLFSSHSLGEVESLCDEVIVLRNGRIVEHQPIDVLKRRALRRVEIRFSRDHQPQLPEPVCLVKAEPQMIRCTWTGDIQRLLEWLNELPVADVVIERPDLSDLFMTYYSNESSLPSPRPPERDDV